jgi:hypothetical protein
MAGKLSVREQRRLQRSYRQWLRRERNVREAVLDLLPRRDV